MRLSSLTLVEFKRRGGETGHFLSYLWQGTGFFVATQAHLAFLTLVHSVPLSHSFAEFS